MDLNIDKVNNPAARTVTLRLKGEVDTHNSHVLDREICLVTEVSEDTSLLDMEGMTFISSSGISVIINAQNMLKQKGAE